MRASTFCTARWSNGWEMVSKILRRMPLSGNAGSSTTRPTSASVAAAPSRSFKVRKRALWSAFSASSNSSCKSSSNTSNASSCAVASRPWTKAARVAKRRVGGMRVIKVTLARLAKRANAAIRLCGIRAAAGRVMPSSRTDLSRSIAARKAGPLTRVGPDRSSSSQEPRLPSGTISNCSSRLRCSAVMPRPNRRQSLVSTLLRRRTTNRSSVLHPGNKILCANNQAVARSKSLLGRSVPVQHRP